MLAVIFGVGGPLVSAMRQPTSPFAIRESWQGERVLPYHDPEIDEALPPRDAAEVLTAEGDEPLGVEILRARVQHAKRHGKRLPRTVRALGCALFRKVVGRPKGPHDRP
jgi:hypothetical protein